MELLNRGQIENYSTIRTPDSLLNGRELATVARGTSFQAVAVVAVTKHGLSTIDTGPGPMYYLVLKDCHGREYRLATPFLGSQKKDLFFAFVDSSALPTDSPNKALTWRSFAYGDAGRESICWTGQLSDIEGHD
jgi:hypothetical protein